MQELLKNSVDISSIIEVCLAKKLNFTAFRMPGAKEPSLIVQKEQKATLINEPVKNLPKRGFVIAPFFREKNNAFLIKPDFLFHGPVTTEQLNEINKLTVNTAYYNNGHYPEDTNKSDYIKLINNSVQKIKEGEFEKVVLSRVKTVKGNFFPFMPALFKTLSNTYPNAFVYIFCVNGQCWTGATPEPFICSQKDELKTVSLAGTRPYNEENLNISNWNNKELKEQEYVTLHIEKILKDYNILHFKKEGPYVSKAGNLLHLRTDFTFLRDSIGEKLPSLIRSLHPTPAVCGMSTDKAMEFIKNSEKHDREYYAGFLGPIGLSDAIKFYVNLRCMKVCDDRLVLFIGGGITLDSIAEDEWEETEIKADTLLSVIKQINN